MPFPLLLIVAMLLIWTFVAKRTTFGRHVYAVGGNAEAARRAGINVARIRILVFMISGAWPRSAASCSPRGSRASISTRAAARSCRRDRGSRDRRHEPLRRPRRGRNALFGSLVIATIANGLNTLGYTSGVIFIVTGAILLLAVTLDTVARRLQVKAGR